MLAIPYPQANLLWLSFVILSDLWLTTKAFPRDGADTSVRSVRHPFVCKEELARSGRTRRGLSLWQDPLATHATYGNSLLYFACGLWADPGECRSPFGPSSLLSSILQHLPHCVCIMAYCTAQ